MIYLRIAILQIEHTLTFVFVFLIFYSYICNNCNCAYTTTVVLFHP